MINFLPGFGWFAAAGLMVASAPVLIHLLNRRRFRVVQWAAIDFLKVAVKRNRRIFEFRDLILLIMRCFALLLFGLALAKPFITADATVSWYFVFLAAPICLISFLAAAALWQRRFIRNLLLAVCGTLALICGFIIYQEKTTGEANRMIPLIQPIHAVVIIDNSLSMGYHKTDSIKTTTLLDEAKNRCQTFIQRLPTGSRISIIPLCGSDEGYSLQPYANEEDALDALNRIKKVVDRQAKVSDAIELATRACGFLPEMPSKRVVFISDQQQINWAKDQSSEKLTTLPEFQIVRVASKQRDNAPNNTPDNAWVASVEVADGVVDLDTPAVIVAKIGYQGAAVREKVKLTLSVDEVPVASRVISLQPSKTTLQEVIFNYQFDSSLADSTLRYVPIKVSISKDRLPEDDFRSRVVPVIKQLPVVFVDQYGSDQENKDYKGATYNLRRLFVSVTQQNETPRSFIKIRHLRIDQLNEEVLADARLVVMAGITEPGDAVSLLKQYVSQGGQLMIAAGGDFDPALWSEKAWQQGDGILPLPLRENNLIVTKKDNPQELMSFRIDFDSIDLAHHYFYLANTSVQEQQVLYRIPEFVKAVIPDDRPAIFDQLRKKESDRETDELKKTSEENKKSAGWLHWKNPLVQSGNPHSTNNINDKLPKVLVRFDDENRSPYIVERKIGQGDVVFVASGMEQSWSTIQGKFAILMFDRILRSMIHSTFDQHNYSTSQSIAFPLQKNQDDLRLVATRPDGESKSITAGALADGQFGVSLIDVSRRGIYQLMAYKPESSTNDPSNQIWPHSQSLSINGPVEESNLMPIPQAELKKIASQNKKFRLIAMGEPISLEGDSKHGHQLWWWFIVCVLVLLVTEMFVLSAAKITPK